MPRSALIIEDEVDEVAAACRVRTFEFIMALCLSVEFERLLMAVDADSEGGSGGGGGNVCGDGVGGGNGNDIFRLIEKSRWLLSLGIIWLVVSSTLTSPSPPLLLQHRRLP